MFFVQLRIALNPLEEGVGEEVGGTWLQMGCELLHPGLGSG